MAKITYRIVKHEDGWAYKARGTFSETFPATMPRLPRPRPRPPSSGCRARLSASDMRPPTVCGTKSSTRQRPAGDRSRGRGRVRRGRLLVGRAVLLVAPGEAWACACCTNPGQRYVEVETLDSGRLEEIERLRFGEEARLFVGGAASKRSPASKIRRSATISRGNWDKTMTLGQDHYRVLSSTNPGGRSGTLSSDCRKYLRSSKSTRATAPIRERDRCSIRNGS